MVRKVSQPEVTSQDNQIQQGNITDADAKTNASARRVLSQERKCCTKKMACRCCAVFTALSGVVAYAAYKAIEEMAKLVAATQAVSRQSYE